MFAKYTKKRGFTLVELIVAVAIFGLLAAMVVANFRQGEKSDDLRSAAAALVSVLRQAQSLAQIGSQNVPATMINTGRFGVHFDLNQSGQYVLFLDYAGVGGPDGQYQSEEALPGSLYNLPAGIVLDSLTPATDDVLDIVFAPPRPVAYFNNSTADDTALIVLNQSAAGQTRTVTIGRLSGQITY